MMANTKRLLLCLSLLALASCTETGACEGESCSVGEDQGVPQAGSAMLQRARSGKADLEKLRVAEEEVELKTAGAESDEEEEYEFEIADEEEDESSQTTYTSFTDSQANERTRAKLLIEGDLSKLDDQHFRAFDEGTSCVKNAEAAFDHLADSSGLAKELTGEEREAFHKRYVSELEYDCDNDPDVRKHWRKDIRAAAENEKPVMTKAKAASLNGAKLSYKVEMQEWMLHESKLTYSRRMGLLEDDEPEPEHSGPDLVQSEEEYFKKHGVNMTDLPATHDPRTKWPHCAGVIGKIHNQGVCGSCWAFAALSAMDSRICIATGGQFSGPRAQLSRGYTTSCVWLGMGCNGGYMSRPIVLMGSGIPTGGNEGCSPYFGTGQGTDHFKQGMPAPACPGHCRSGYGKTVEQDKFKSSGTGWYTIILPIGWGLRDAKRAMLNDGPIPFGMYADDNFMGYKGGIFSQGCGIMGNHAVTALGWGQGYWISMNSWGSHWGIGGLFYHNDCTIRQRMVVPGPLTGNNFDSLLPMRGATSGSGSHPTPKPSCAWWDFACKLR
mmetsp:Transcript_13190/g.29936  ORF Transcript_13190/g.29936 Transcript_13190/m.29936 type:complete len:552 (-) Transcript_13190:128-1783(-)